MRGDLLQKKCFVLRALVLLCLMMLAACSVAPVQEMSDARQAVQAAKTAGVAVDNSALLELAEDRLKSAELKLKRRWYDSAREDALVARDAAVKARLEQD